MQKNQLPEDKSFMTQYKGSLPVNLKPKVFATTVESDGGYELYSPFKNQKKSMNRRMAEVAVHSPTAYQKKRISNLFPQMNKKHEENAADYQSNLA